jgi:hypothetical protein
MSHTGIGPDDLVITRAVPEQWSTVTDWAADEGWNPGIGDVNAFFTQDPHGFFLGSVHGEPVSAISVVNYDAGFAFLGCYLVRPDLRGRGLGVTTWRAGLRHAGRRTVGLDGVPDQQDSYKISGFRLAYRTARFTGVPDLPPADASVQPLAALAGISRLYPYDSACLPADRAPFLPVWLLDPNHYTVLRIVDGALTGYGVLRPAHDSLRVGPLFADTAADATLLLAALAERAAGAPLAVDVPLCNAAGVRLAERAGLRPSFETARMYTGPTRPYAQDRVYGVTTLELG